MGSALIRGRYVVTGVAGGRATVIEDGAVFQRDGVVVDVGPAAALAHHAADVALGSPDHVVLPDFVNSHHHVGLTPFQLGSPDLPLELWFASRLGTRDVDPYLDTLYRPYLDGAVAPVDAVVHRGRATHVDTVMVAGEVVLRDGRFTRVDKASALAELAARLCAPLSPEEERRRRLAREIFPHVRRFYDGWLDAAPRDPFYAPSARR